MEWLGLVKNRETLGKYLQEARDSKGITLRLAEKKLHIRKAYLEALEAGDYDNIPSEVYIRGFLRSYAKFLGLPVEQCVRLYEKEKKELLAKVNDELEEYEFDDDDEGTKNGWISNWLVGIIAFFLVVGLGVWYGPSGIRFLNNQTATPQGEAIEVVITTKKNVWVQVWIDGVVHAEGFSMPGEEHRWKGIHEIQIIVGDGSAVNIHTNGFEEGVMTERTETARRIFRVTEKHF